MEELIYGVSILQLFANITNAQDNLISYQSSKLIPTTDIAHSEFNAFFKIAIPSFHNS